MRLHPIELLLFSSLILAAIAPAFANEAAPESMDSVKPCAIVDRNFGEVQILNESRTKISEADHKVPVYCGGWVSTEQGWLTLVHRFGYQIHVGPNSFVQFPDQADAVVVYRGEVFAQAGGGMGELRMLTPNAHVSLSRGSAIALFDSEEEKSQLTVVDGKGVFENRFDDTHHSSMVVKSGYTSNLDFKLLRVVPSVPKIVSTASLKQKLNELHVPLAQSQRAVAVAKNRQAEFFAAFDKNLNEPQKSRKPLVASAASQSGRAPASERKPASSVRHGGTVDGGGLNEDYLVRKTFGGSAEGMKMISPAARPSHGSHGAKVQVDDPEAQLMARQKSAQAAEKRKLIEELSRIQAE